MVPEGLCYGDEAAPRRGCELYPSEGGSCCWGVQAKAGGVQLLLGTAIEGQVRYLPQAWEHQEYEDRDFRERTQDMRQTQCSSSK